MSVSDHELARLLVRCDIYLAENNNNRIDRLEAFAKLRNFDITKPIAKWLIRNEQLAHVYDRLCVHRRYVNDAIDRVNDEKLNIRAVCEEEVPYVLYRLLYWATLSDRNFNSLLFFCSLDLTHIDNPISTLKAVPESTC